MVAKKCTSIKIVDILVFGLFVLGLLQMFAIAFLVRAFGSVNDYVDFVCFALGSLLDAALRFLGFSPWLLTGFDLVSGGLVDL